MNSAWIFCGENGVDCGEKLTVFMDCGVVWWKVGSFPLGFVRVFVRFPRAVLFGFTMLEERFSRFAHSLLLLLLNI